MSGQTSATLAALRTNPATTRGKARCQRRSEIVPRGGVKVYQSWFEKGDLEAQGNRVSHLWSDEADEVVVVPSGDFSP
jgi:hypothetical protein